MKVVQSLRAAAQPLRRSTRATAQVARPHVIRIDVDARLSEAAIHNGTVYLAGQIPEIKSSDEYEQTKDVLRCVDQLLARCGSHKSLILMAMCYLTGPEYFPGFNKAWDEWTADMKGSAPPRATVTNVKLADPSWKVEVVVTAAQRSGTMSEESN